MTHFDVLIIGAGAAGMSAAIFAARKKLKTAIVTIDIGGQTNLTNHIENYPGYEERNGHKLMKCFEKTATKCGAQFIFGKVEQIEKKGPQEFHITLTNKEVYTTKCVILAVGKVPKELEIPGEKEFLGRGISLCSAQDINSCKNKKVVVIGGGNAALETARDAAKVAQQVTIVHRRDAFRADEITIEMIKKKQNISYELNAEVKEIKGKGQVEKVNIIQGDKIKEILAEMIFIEIGYVTATKFLNNLVELSKTGEIIIDVRCKTSQEGIFACGDATTVPFKQTVISAGEGAKAALEAYLYLTGGKGVTIDWV